MTKLPEKFESRMRLLLGDDYDKYIDAMTASPVRGLRVNTKKISVEDFVAHSPFNLEKIPYSDNGFYFEGEHVGYHPFHHAGMFYVQEPGAMMPVECLDIDPDWTVLDMCAAPGGKSTQIKCKLNDSAVLVSNEIIPSRCKILTGNIERMGLKNVVTTCMDSKRIAVTFPHAFDLITVDAPCSGEGMFRKDETAINEWSEENVKMCAGRQLEILDNAVTALKDGGYIIYATCTFSLEENEMVIDKFLENHCDFELVPATDRVQHLTSDGIHFDGCKCENIRYCRRFYPHKGKGEGQFAAILKNTATPSNFKSKFGKSSFKVDDTVIKFLDDTLVDYEKSHITMYNGNPVIFSGNLDIKKGTAFSCGITIGEIKKNYILPHHQFFMAMGGSFKRKIDLLPDSDKLAKYLHGEEFSTDCEDGWAVVTVCGCSVGGVKVVSGRAKNHYPKGLRTKTVYRN